MKLTLSFCVLCVVVVEWNRPHHNFHKAVSWSSRDCPLVTQSSRMFCNTADYTLRDTPRQRWRLYTVQLHRISGFKACSFIIHVIHSSLFTGTLDIPIKSILHVSHYSACLLTQFSLATRSLGIKKKIPVKLSLVCVCSGELQFVSCLLSHSVSLLSSLGGHLQLSISTNEPNKPVNTR